LSDVRVEELSGNSLQSPSNSANNSLRLQSNPKPNQYPSSSPKRSDTLPSLKMTRSASSGNVGFQENGYSASTPNSGKSHTFSEPGPPIDHNSGGNRTTFKGVFSNMFSSMSGS
jgi:hypothetical protein